MQELHPPLVTYDLESMVSEPEVLVPICSHGKSIRQGDNHWPRVEKQLTHRSDAFLTHGICPTCYEARVRHQLDRLKLAG